MPDHWLRVLETMEMNIQGTLALNVFGQGDYVAEPDLSKEISHETTEYLFCV